MDRGKHCQSNTGLDKLITKFCGVDSRQPKSSINKRISIPFCLLDQHFFDSLPDHAVTDNKILQKDTLLCLFQIL